MPPPYFRLHSFSLRSENFGAEFLNFNYCFVLLIARLGLKNSENFARYNFELWKKWYNGTRSRCCDRESWTLRLTFQSQDVFVLRRLIDGEAVGALLLSDPGDDSIEVDNIVVGSSAEGRGYGRLLMNYAKHVARERSRSALVLYTNEKMTENIAPYAKINLTSMMHVIRHRVCPRNTRKPYRAILER